MDYAEYDCNESENFGRIHTFHRHIICMLMNQNRSSWVVMMMKIRRLGDKWQLARIYFIFNIVCIMLFFFSVNVTETPASVVISIAHQCDVRARAHTTDIHILEEKSGSAAYMICRQYVEEIVTHLVSVFCFLHHRTIKKHTQRYLTILLFPVCLCRFVIFPRNTHNHTDRHYSQ